jgi:general secretion pathway protein E
MRSEDHLMQNLVIKPDGWQGRNVRLTEDPVSIGRHPDNTIRIKDDRASRFHCVIEPDGHGRYQVRDLDSRNGTKVNSIKIDNVFLEAGDRLKIGIHEFLIYADEMAADDTAGQSKGKSGKATGKPTGKSKGKASTKAKPVWERDLKEMLETLPPKGEFETIVTLIDASGQDSSALETDADGPRALTLLHQLASKSRATDIHVEPKPDSFNIRMRVDGQMIPIVELPADVGSLMLGLVKTACEVPSLARDAVVDGHYSLRFPDRRIEMRASFTPAVHGSKLVLRLLDQRASPRSIDDLGLAPYARKRVQRIVEQDHGLLMVCGPTGSGKTTTLYNCLREIDRDTKNVVTIEDPVEYTIEGVTQIPIEEHKGNTFGTLLRSVLRQDPDVILVGEIRDAETARTATQAAMTGHVVLSTVHAKDTISSVFRLLDLGIEPYLVANSLDMVLAQRLVRVLCGKCRREVPVSPQIATRLGRFLGSKTNMYVPTGCARCLRTGYRGRRAIFELLDVNDELRDVILTEPSIQAMKRVIEAGLFTTLAQSGWKLVAIGETSLEEIDRVAGQG